MYCLTLNDCLKEIDWPVESIEEGDIRGKKVVRDEVNVCNVSWDVHCFQQFLIWHWLIVKRDQVHWEKMKMEEEEEWPSTRVNPGGCPPGGGASESLILNFALTPSPLIWHPSSFLPYNPCLCLNGAPLIILIYLSIYLFSFFPFFIFLFLPSFFSLSFSFFLLLFLPSGLFFWGGRVPL